MSHSLPDELPYVERQLRLMLMATGALTLEQINRWAKDGASAFADPKLVDLCQRALDLAAQYEHDIAVELGYSDDPEGDEIQAMRAELEKLR